MRKYHSSYDSSICNQRFNTGWDGTSVKQEVRLIHECCLPRLYHFQILKALQSNKTQIIFPIPEAKNSSILVITSGSCFDRDTEYYSTPVPYCQQHMQKNKIQDCRILLPWSTNNISLLFLPYLATIHPPSSIYPPPMPPPPFPRAFDLPFFLCVFVVIVHQSGNLSLDGTDIGSLIGCC